MRHVALERSARDVAGPAVLGMEVQFPWKVEAGGMRHVGGAPAGLRTAGGGDCVPSRCVATPSTSSRHQHAFLASGRNVSSCSHRFHVHLRDVDASFHVVSSVRSHPSSSGPVESDALFNSDLIGTKFPFEPETSTLRKRTYVCNSSHRASRSRHVRVRRCNGAARGT